MIRSKSNRRLKALRHLASGRGRAQASQRAASLLALTPALSSALDADPHLAQDAAKEAWNLLLLEGPHLVNAALDSGIELLQTFATESFLEGCEPVLDRLSEHPRRVDEKLLDALADADSPRGLVAVAKAPQPFNPAHLANCWTSVLFLDQLRDPGNVGAILRVAEATSVDLVVLSRHTVSWRHPRALRASAGSALRVPIAEDWSPAELDRALPESSTAGTPATRWYGFVTDGENLFSHPVPAPRVLALGSEAHGLSEEVAAHCSIRLSLPMAGQLESLNVATATAVALFELNRRQS